MDKAEFLNAVRSLHNIDGYQLPELNWGQQLDFVQNPVKYFIRADDEQQAAIWREVSKRQKPTDWWSPDPEDPFWMLEVRQGLDDAGAWLKNRNSQLVTREPTKALRFPTAASADACRIQLGGGGHGRFEPTEHLWTRENLGSEAA